MWWVFQTILFQPYFTWNSTYTAMVLQQVEELVHWLPLWQGVEVTTAMITSAIAIAIVLNTATKYCLAKAKLYKKSWKLLMGFLWSLVICKDLFEKTWSDKKKGKHRNSLSSLGVGSIKHAHRYVAHLHFNWSFTSFPSWPLWRLESRRALVPFTKIVLLRTVGLQYAHLSNLWCLWGRAANGRRCNNCAKLPGYMLTK